jgi:hypothetical protein
MKPDLLSMVFARPDQRPVLPLADWEMILGQARQSRLVGRLARQLADRNWLEDIPLGPRNYLEGALRMVDRQHHEVQWEVDCIRRALKNVNTPVVLLKGAAYFMAGLPPRNGRIFSDIDIMVERKRLPDIEGALFRAGWISEERDAYNERYYRQWMHEIPPMRHVQRGTVIDVHHTITPPTSRFKVDGSSLLEHLEAIDERRDLFVLSPMDMVLNSAVHLFQEGEFGHGLRDLLDLKDLLEHFEKKDKFWPGLLDRADELGLQIPLFHALFHIRRLFGFIAPAEWERRVNQLSPTAPARVIMGWMLGLALRPEHPSSDTRWTGLARWLLYVRSHALRMPLQLVLVHLVRKSWMRQFPKKMTTS